MYASDLIERIVKDNSHGIDISYFYRTRLWKNKAKKIKAEQKECFYCKQKGRYRQPDMVHHINHLRDRPDLALSETFTDAEGNEQLNLVAVCNSCHKSICHPEQLEHLQKFIPKAKPLTAERWD